MFTFFKKNKNLEHEQATYTYEIRYNVNPPTKTYEISTDEKRFINQLFSKSMDAGFYPNKYRFTRMSNGTISVDYDYLNKGGFVGKVKLQGKKKYILFMENLQDSATIEGELNECLVGIDSWLLYMKKYFK